MKIDKNYMIGIGVIGIVAGALAYYFGSRTGKATTAAIVSDTLTAEIKKEPLTYELSQYETFAQKIYTAVYDFGTDEQAIYEVFSKMSTRSDVLQLIKTFGVRNIIPFVNEFTLIQWLESDLNGAEIQHINEILTRNGIDYIF